MDQIQVVLTLEEMIMDQAVVLVVVMVLDQAVVREV